MKGAVCLIRKFPEPQFGIQGISNQSVTASYRVSYIQFVLTLAKRSATSAQLAMFQKAFT